VVNEPETTVRLRPNLPIPSRAAQPGNGCEFLRVANSSILSGIMSLPPEVVFHRYFQSRVPLEQRRHRGKADLDRLNDSTIPSTLLAGLQNVFNDALLNEKRDVPTHVRHGEFHVDYIDSDAEDALAFSDGGYAFIGLTVPFVRHLWEVTSRLSAQSVGQLRDALQLRDTAAESVAVVLFRLQLNFVVCHEFTHHVHGHVAQDSMRSEFASESDDLSSLPGGLQQQIFEADADGYAAYYVLTNLFTGTEHQHALDVLAIGERPANERDEILLACFLVAVAGQMFARPPQLIDSATIYGLRHPPQAARMSLLMDSTMTWCRQNRSTLVKWMTLTRFQILMNGVATATWGMNGGKDWDAQNAFLHTAAGAEYFKRLSDGIKAHIAGLGTIKQAP
jgi:hypothetical protein